MIAGLKKLLARLRAWMAENERAHRNAKGGACCSSPSSIYAARKRDGEGAGHE